MFISSSALDNKNTFGNLVFLADFCLEVQHHMIQLLDEELVFVVTLVRDVKNRVFVGRLVVHVEDDVRFGDRDYVCKVLGPGSYPRLADRDVHVRGIFLQHLNRA